MTGNVTALAILSRTEQVTLVEQEVQRIVETRIYEAFGLSPDHFIEDGVLYRWNEQWYGSHCSDEKVRIRLATGDDRAALRVIEVLRKG